MATRLFYSHDGKECVFVCDTSDMAFGPIMDIELVEKFREWLEKDPRLYNSDFLSTLYFEFLEDLKKEELKRNNGK
jgi:hypothetical protein